MTRVAAVVGVWLALLPPVAAAETDALYAALLDGNSQAVAGYVTDHYRRAGASISEAWTLTLQPFDRIVDWYDPATDEVVVSAIPRPSEVARYWDNWSMVLTGGHWQADRFFRDAAEAQLLASFNQLLITAHEFGHAIVARYDRGYEERWDFEINCREYAADRLADALLGEVASGDARFAAMVARYQDLIADLNAGVPDGFRYGAVTASQLREDCRVMHVEQGSDSKMTAYASAFFVRHLALLGAEPASLAQLLETELFPHWRAAQLPSFGGFGGVTTLKHYPDLDLATPDRDFEIGARLATISPEGDLFVVDAGLTGGTPARAGLRFGAAGEPAELITPTTLPGTSLTTRHLHFSSAAVLNRDHVLAFASDLGFATSDCALIDARRSGAGWIVRARQFSDYPGAIGWVAAGADGKLYVFLDAAVGLVRLELDQATLATVATHQFPGRYGTPMSVGRNGTSYFRGADVLVGVGDDGIARAAAGNGLRGYKDAADATAAEFIYADRFGATADGGLVVLDLDPSTRQYTTRRVAPLPVE